jgi:RimJ/RimL family protein N-acetyltransferase
MVLWRIRTEVDDNPGRLAALAGALAAYGGNVLGLSVQAVECGVVDEFFVDVPAAVPEAQLMGALAFAGGRRPVAVPADMHELVDTPLRALRLADQLRRDPEALPNVLAELLGAQECEWLPAGETARLDEGDHDTAVLTLRTPSGRTVVARRYALPFTTTEVARAHAMLAFLNLETEPHPPPARGCWVVLPDGTDIVIRRAVPADRAAVSAMHDRCSAHSRYLRYLAPTPRVPGRALDRLLSADRGVALVAVAPDGRVIGLGNLIPASGGGSGAGTGTAEAALLVEDAWQGRRIGTSLFRRLVSLGRELGLTEVSATVLPSNARMWRLLRKGGLVEEAGPGGGLLRMRGMLCLPGSPLDDRGPAGPGDDTVRATISAPAMAGSTV